MWPLIITGFTLGLISSIHCVGMCGPIALALPVYHLPAPKRMAGLVLYNVGRVVTYAVLGLLFGLIGRKLHMAGLQQWLSIALGLLILLFLFYSHNKAISLPGPAAWIYGKVQASMAKMLKVKSTGGLFLLGMLNGLLPCGMVYLAVAGALSTNNLWDGSLFMVSYGSGTIPAMLTLSLFGVMISVKARNHMKSLIPYMVALMAFLLILRGMNLGIPFISPLINHDPGTPVSCH
jgi:uncharacterized protein